jgi:hypothetical protein
VFPPDETAELSRPKLVSTTPLDDPAPEDSGAPGPFGFSGWQEGSFIDERYHLQRRLGGGAMGEVWLARDNLLKKGVALKVLRPELAKSRATVRRFLQEVALAQSVTHPHVVRIHDTGEAHGLPYFTMEHLQGQTLDQLVGRHGALPSSDTPPMSLREIRELCIEILAGLEAAHRAGVIHRDLKPANVILTHRGAILMDFGVAGLETLPGLAKAGSPDPAQARSLIRTEAGTIFGSPAYMAPELWDGASATVQSDLYSFGVMLYQMLTGQLPYDAPNASAFLEKLRTTTPVPVTALRKDAPWRLAAAVRRCMARAPEERPSSARTVADLVTPLARRRGLLAATGALLTGGAIAAAVVQRGGPDHEQLGLPDQVAQVDLHAAIRAWDVGDHESARRQLDRLAIRAPASAAVAFWRATIDRELRDHAARTEHCRRDDGATFQGSAEWIDVAESACGSNYSLGPAVLGTLDRRAGALDEGYLPIAVEGSLVPQLEVGFDRSGLLMRQAQAVLDRLDEGPSLESGPLTPIRWDLARADLNIALGRTDMARELIARLLDTYPDAPAVKHRAASLYGLMGERGRAQAWAEDVAPYDPRAQLRLELDAGRLADAWARIEALGADPYGPALVDMWCGYAFRFELPTPPAACTELEPGLVRTLWGRATGRGTDGATMTPHERSIAGQQAGLNLGECLDRAYPGPVLTSSSPPFETYLTQLQVSAAICPHTPGRSRLDIARQLAEQLTRITPEDPWSMLLQAQLDEAEGSPALARSRRMAVAEKWATADQELPLVARLRATLGIAPSEPPSEPEPEPLGPEPPPEALDPDAP